MTLSGHAQSLLSRLSDSFKADFTPEKVLGEGAMGVVLLATQRRLERRVAIKFLLCFSDRDALNRFGREAQLSSLLDHPRIVRLYTSGVDGELPYIVYEYVAGRTLKDVIEAPEKPTPAQALLHATALCEGLVYAHGQQIVHRDLKPANVLVGDDGTLKIADYGIGSSLAIEWALTRTGTLMGTPAYMAPEQWSSATTVASDVYAAGVILHEMLTGVNPFVKKTMIGTRNAHVHEPRARLGDGFDPRLDELLDAMNAKVPEERPDAAACLARLQEIRTTRPSRGTSPTSALARASGRATPIAAEPAVTATGGAAVHTTGGAGRKPASGPRVVSTQPAAPSAPGGRGAWALRAGLALVIFIAGLAPFLRQTAQLAGPVVVVAGSRCAALALECSQPGAPGATVEPGVAGLSVTSADRDGGRRRWTVTLTGLEPGVAYRVQPLLDGRPAGPPVPVTTLGGPEQLASVTALAFVDAHTLAVRFRTPLANAAALTVASTTPTEWVPGAAGAPREARLGGLDPARTCEPVLRFDGLPETVPLGPVPGATAVVERARRALASDVGGPAFADRQALLKRIAARAQKRAVSAERVREEIERHVRDGTGQPLELVASAARVLAEDEHAPVLERWRAREVLDGLFVLESIGHPWCGAWVVDPAGRRAGVPRWEWVGRAPRPPEAAPLAAWVPDGPVRALVDKSTLPLWTHRDRKLDSLFLLNDEVAQSFGVEPALAKKPHWAWLTPPAPPETAGDVELVLKVYNLVEDQILWLRLGEHTLAIPAERGTRGSRNVSIAARQVRSRAVRVTVPADVWRDAKGVEVRADGFQATESAPVADEIWIADAWLAPLGP